MRRAAVLGLLLLTGCSTAPIAGTLDCFFPSRGSGPERPDRGPDITPRDREPPERAPRDRFPPPTLDEPLEPADRGR